MGSIETRFFDLVIAGGGMVGASLACALQPLVKHRGLRVAVVEAISPSLKNKQGCQPGYDARSTALSWESRCIYERFGIWPELAGRATPIRSIHISDQGHFGAARLHAGDQGVEALGYVLENAWLGEVLSSRVRHATDITWLSPAQVVKAKCESGRMLLQVCSQETELEIETTLLVVADGGRSRLCDDLQIAFETQSYGQHAVVANVSLPRSHHHRAYERFTPQGPLALLPLEPDVDGSDRSSLVWSVASETVDEVMALDDDQFLASLQRTFGYRLGHFCKIGKRDYYPLSRQIAREQIRPGLVVVGNAAHRLHPVAGQGFNLALRGVESLVKALSVGMDRGLSLGAPAVLQQYLSQRQGDQARMLGFTDGLVRLFSNQDLLLGLSRDFGLVALDMLPMVKKYLVRRAMGLGS